jgi:hypothetical protein
MTDDGDLLADMVSQLRPEVPTLISYWTAATEIGETFGIVHEAATMLLYGLVASANVRAADRERKEIDPEKITLDQLDEAAVFVSAEDVRHWLNEWSPLQLSRRDEVIRKFWRDGDRPGSNIAWKAFANKVRKVCRAKETDRGFGLKQIQRIVKGYS